MKFFILAMFLAFSIFAGEIENDKINTQNQQKISQELPQNVCMCEEKKCDLKPNVEKKSPCMSCGYNAPFRYKTSGCCDFYVKGSFIYWQPLEEGLTFAKTIENQPIISTGPFLGSEMIEMDFDYKPGFKVGVGLLSDYDNWDVFFEYTWFHQTQTQIKNPPKSGRLLYYPWFNSQNVQEANQPYALDIKSSWNLDMDLINLELARSYFVGRKLTFRPFVGAKAMWIDQSINILANIIDWGNKEVKNRSQSWALGARSGLYTNWILGKGFKSFANLAACLLYTDYHKVSKDEDAIDTVTFGSRYMDSSNKFRYLRTSLEFTLGFGYGCYFSNNNHFDFNIGYDFNGFFHQNMMRFYSDELSSASAIDHLAGNLYTHGLNASFMLNF
jgi:hypothetical protein